MKATEHKSGSKRAMSLISAEAGHTLIAGKGAAARILPIEGVRGLAVFLVFFVHLHPFFGAQLQGHAGWYGASEALAALGNAGVDLFFLLSGFLIYGIVLKRTRTYLDFVRRRIRRIYPVFTAVLLLYLILGFVFPSQSKLQGSAAEQLAYVAENYLLLPGITHIRPIITVAWSLSYEFFFYLTIPLVVRFVFPERLRPIQRVAILAVWYLAGLVLLHPLGLERLQSFCLGMLLYEFSQMKPVTDRMTRAGQWVALAAFAGALVCGYYIFMPTARVQAHAMFARYLAYPLMSIGFFVFGAYSFVFSGFLSKFFVWGPIRSLGRISYSYYLIHGLTLAGLRMALAARSPAWSGPAMFCAISIVGFVLTCLSAGLVFLFIEEPLSLHGQSTLSRYWQRWTPAWRASPGLSGENPPAE